VERAHRTIANSQDLCGEFAEMLRLSRRTKEWVAAVRADAWHVCDHEGETGREETDRAPVAPSPPAAGGEWAREADPDDDPERTGEFAVPILEPHAAAGVVSWARASRTSASNGRVMAPR